MKEKTNSDRIHLQLDLLDQSLNLAKLTKFYKSQLGSIDEFRNPVSKLKTFPYLEKAILNQEHKSFNASPWPSIPAHTSGTTGTPLRLRRNIASIAREAAGFFAWYHSAGWRPDDMMIILRGDLVVATNRTQAPFGLRDAIFNRWVLSSYHLSEHNMPWYYNHIKISQAKFLSAYPSSAYILADYIRRAKLKPLNLKAVFLASETVFDHQRKIIEEFLGPVNAQYGNAERTVWMTTCSHNHYHEDVSYGYTEYVPLQDNMYEIVTTSFINSSMPLIRYRTGDIAIEPFDHNTKCSCGQFGPGCKQIIGRIDDLFITPDKRLIGRLDHIFKGINHLVMAQIEQLSISKSRINLIKTNQFTQSDENSIKEQFFARIGCQIELKFNYVDFIPRTNNGKFRAVISRINN